MRKYAIVLCLFFAFTSDLTYASIPAPVIQTNPVSSESGNYTIHWTWSGSGTLARYELMENGSNIYIGLNDFYNASAKNKGNFDYKVRACVSGQGCGPYSAIHSVNVYIPAPQFISPPQTSTGNISLSWSSVDYVKRYELYENNTYIPVGTATSKSLNRTPGTYTYKIRACRDGQGCGEYSSSITIEVAIPIPQSPVLNLPSIDTDGTINMTWNAVSYASEYRLSINNNGTFTRLFTGNGFSFEDVRPSGNYRYGIYACNSQEECSTINWKDISVEIPTQVLGAITSVYLDPTDSHYKISGWACEVGNDSPLGISLQIGNVIISGPSLSRTQTPYQAQQQCNSASSQLGFSKIIPFDDVMNKAGLSINGVAYAKTDDTVKTLSGSGFKMPHELPMSYLESHDTDSNIVIPAGYVVEFDSNLDVGLIDVYGVLKCPNTTNEYQIKTSGITVMGQNAAFVCGTEESRFFGNVSFIMNGDVEKNIGAMSSYRGIIAMNGGTLSLHGTKGKSGFVRLSESANPQDTSILLDSKVNESGLNWEVGDEIVLAASGFDPSLSETLQITSIASEGNVSRVSVYPSIKYFHWGGVQDSYSHRDKSLDLKLNESAEVANLSRNIVITIPASDDDGSSNEGAHMMVMGNDSKAFIDDVEFYRVGQMGKLGRYPFHWHEKGNVSGQYIRGASIHQSFNRCVTVHKTNYAEVTRNTCFDHFGHGYFLELGTEIHNKIEGNISIFAKKVPQDRSLLISEVTSKFTIDGTNSVQDHEHNGRFNAPANFWISHPNNDVNNNVASGSEGSGFWMAFGNTSATGYASNQDTSSFNNNIAHSSVVGITHDGAAIGKLVGNPLNMEGDRYTLPVRYNPDTVPEFVGLQAFKNSKTGIYYRGERAIYRNAILADNGVSFFVTNNQELVNSLVVGLSNYTDDLPYHDVLDDDGHTIRGRNPTNYAGVQVYDGPFYLEKVHFMGFPIDIRLTDSGKDITPVPFRLIGASRRFGDVVNKITFEEKQPKYMFDFGRVMTDYNAPASGQSYSGYHASVTDIGGESFTMYSDGVENNKVIRPGHIFNEYEGCPTQTGNNVVGQPFNICNVQPLTTVRVIDRNSTWTDLKNFTLHRTRKINGVVDTWKYIGNMEFSIVSNGEFEHKITYDTLEDGPEYDVDNQEFNINIATDAKGEFSDVFELNFPEANYSNCSLSYTTTPTYMHPSGAAIPDGAEVPIITNLNEANRPKEDLYTLGNSGIFTMVNHQGNGVSVFLRLQASFDLKNSVESNINKGRGAYRLSCSS